MNKIDSPRIATLSSELKQGDRTSLTRFWEEVARQGASLIEPIPNDDRHRLVTFLWRANGNGKTDSVAVIGGPLPCWLPEEPYINGRHDFFNWQGGLSDGLLWLCN